MINRTTLRPELRCNYSAEASAESASAKILNIRFKPNLTYCAEASVFCQSFGDLPCFGHTFGLNIWQNRPKLRQITEGSARSKAFIFGRSFGVRFGRSLGFGRTGKIPLRSITVSVSPSSAVGLGMEYFYKNLAYTTLLS